MKMQDILRALNEDVCQSILVANRLQNFLEAIIDTRSVKSKRHATGS
jgi:hypothetical protein